MILAETVWGFDWAQDDTNTEEISLVDHLTNLGNSDGANQVRALETVLSYDWLRDDVTSVELAFMENLERLTEIAAEDHADALETVLSYATPPKSWPAAKPPRPSIPTSEPSTKTGNSPKAPNTPSATPPTSPRPPVMPSPLPSFPRTRES